MQVANEEKEAGMVAVSSEGEIVGGERKETGHGIGEDRDKKGSGEERENIRENKDGEVKGETTVTGKKKSRPAPNSGFFQHLSSSQNAFSGLAGTGFSTSSFTFGSGTTSTSVFGAVLINLEEI